METDGGPNLSQGVALDRLADGEMLQGTVNGEEVILARRGDEFFAVGASCPHYGGRLVEGLLHGDEVRCPLHHACFSLRTGEALRAPAFDAIPCWRVERVGERVFVREKVAAPIRKMTIASSGSPKRPASVVIIGAGAAGFAAADMLRREGYDKPVTMISADEAAPYDRPNLSKDYLAGTAPDEWIPLRPPAYYRDQRLDLLLNSRVSSLDVQQKRVHLDNGKSYEYGALLLATGATPVTLALPGASDSQVYYLRSFADSRTLAQKAASAKQVVIVGASFIGLETAASLRSRGIAVHIVAPDQQPLARVMGSEVGRFIRTLHEAQGVVFHLEQTVARVDGSKVTLSGGAILNADLLVLGVGVRPSLALAEQAGLKVDRGVVVDEYLQSSAPGVFAAGDIARWPDPHSGGPVRIEHWVVAQRQGQVAARNILGRRERFDAVPFFWTAQYDVTIRYVGHAEKWDVVDIKGSLDAKDCAVAYKSAGRTLAVATISRDLHSLQVEASMEASIASPHVKPQ
jgi:NADPH-dependent 2,4-dienoyl-CoA reductase/sulfur reductase-like enzyme/nitrite reductase/ring-hydroxylating ferredoxin subunit